MSSGMQPLSQFTAHATVSWKIPFWLIQKTKTDKKIDRDGVVLRAVIDMETVWLCDLQLGWESLDVGVLDSRNNNCSTELFSAMAAWCTVSEQPKNLIGSQHLFSVYVHTPPDFAGDLPFILSSYMTCFLASAPSSLHLV